eukprot:comp17215_c0_seq1/m.16185 comp17215_c0_seq1/g.16185  ORF comp17215_c0_seq1/g.16185 comp17215_c0_seq1/m.16185 type:complete len:523 (-) comp17215_c0_seq1:865-2433(-)
MFGKTLPVVCVWAVLCAHQSLGAVTPIKGAACTVPNPNTNVQTIESGSLLILSTCETYTCNDGVLTKNPADPSTCTNTQHTQCITYTGTFVPHGSTTTAGGCTYTCADGVLSQVDAAAKCQRKKGPAAPYCLVESGDVLKSGDVIKLGSCATAKCNNGIMETVVTPGCPAAATAATASCQIQEIGRSISHGTTVKIGECSIGCDNGKRTATSACPSTKKIISSTTCLLEDGSLLKDGETITIDECKSVLCHNGVDAIVDTHKCSPNTTDCKLPGGEVIKHGVTKKSAGCSVECNNGITISIGNECKAAKHLPTARALPAKAAVRLAPSTTCSLPDGRPLPEGSSITIDTCVRTCTKGSLKEQGECKKIERNVAYPSCLLEDGSLLKDGEFVAIDKCKTLRCTRGVPENFDSGKCDGLKKNPPTCCVGKQVLQKDEIVEMGKCKVTCFGGVVMTVGECEAVLKQIDAGKEPMYVKGDCKTAQGGKMTEGEVRQLGPCHVATCKANGKVAVKTNSLPACNLRLM